MHESMRPIPHQIRRLGTMYREGPHLQFLYLAVITIAPLALQSQHPDQSASDQQPLITSL
jgi:hypothetical protein